MSTLPTGTVTFLFSDLTGSTRLWEDHPEAMRSDLARHDALVRAAITAHGGHVFKTGGDAFYAAFATAPGGLRAALEAQRALHGASWTVGGAGLCARMALHTGEAQERDGDYFGHALSRTARLRDAAHGGQTVLTQATEQLVRDALPADARLQDLGPHRLPGLSLPEQVFQLHHPGLPDTFPPLRSLDQCPNNLPQRLDSFVGREHDLAHVKGMLHSTRLLTLTGVGGAGKTRLAQRAAAERLGEYPDGVWLVALEALSDPALVPQAVAAAVGVREQPGQPLTASLCETLQTRRLLLLLDNCEHLIAACAHMAQMLLQSCPRVQILATSREPLAISGEATFPVPTLAQASPTPPGPADGPGEPSEAVRLFVDRAALSLPSFTLTAQNAPVIARICRQLDGLPLAIELAAPRVRTLTPGQISERLGGRFRLLSGGSRTALPRQQTMQATIQWSHDLLSEPERALFRRLSVFAGGWTLEAAERVCSGDGLDEWDVTGLLSSLVAKSLVQSDEDGDGAHRCRMLETLRQYSWEQLVVSPGFDAVRDRHRDWFLGLAERAEPELRGPQQGAWLDRLETEHDNFRAALAWADGGTRLRLAVLLHRFWYTRGFLREGRGWLEEAIAGAGGGAGPVLIQALNAVGVLAWYQSDHDAAFGFQTQALALSEASGDTEGVARTRINLGILCDDRQDYPGAKRHYDDGLRLFRTLGDDRNVARALINLASHFIHRGDPDAALPYLEEILTLPHAAEDRWPLAIVYDNFALVALDQGDPPAACGWLARSLVIRRELGDPIGVAACLLPAARAVHAQGGAESAAALLGAADAVHTRLGTNPRTDGAQEAAILAQALSRELGQDAYSAAWARGNSLGTEAAADYALQALQRTHT